MARRRLADRLARLETRRTVTDPVVYLSEEASALGRELMATFQEPETPDVIDRRIELARRLHEILPPEV